MPINDLSSVLSPTTRKGLAEDIVREIREAILTGRFGPGERLPEEALARALGVSRGPIREALTQLERQGLVISERNRGSFVARLTREDLDEVYTLRSVIEPLAVRRVVAQASDQDVSRLQALVDEIEDAWTLGIGPVEAAELDMRFHDSLYQLAGHRRLLATWEDLRSQIHILLLNRNITNADYGPMIVSSHQLIVDAIRKRNEREAIAQITDHINGSYQRVAASYTASGAGAAAGGT